MSLRGNRHEITNDGWYMIKTTKKIQKDDDSQFVFAHEKGYNTILKCLTLNAKKLLLIGGIKMEVNGKWSEIKWDIIYSSNKDLTLKPTVDDKKLYSYLFSPSIDEKNEIDSTIDMFLDGLN